MIPDEFLDALRQINTMKLHRLQIEDLLWERQLQVYPDSRRVALPEVMQTWLNEDNPELDERAARFQAIGVPPPINLWNTEHRMYVARSVALCLQQPVGVFYECHNTRDGTYTCRGFRFGFEIHEYAAGFGRY